MSDGDCVVRHAYLHGFSSDARSYKGQRLAEVYRSHGLELELLELNRPSFSRVTMSGALAALDEAHANGSAGAKWRIIGSSMGGFLTALWSTLHPERVDRAMSLCPAFAFESRWNAVIGEVGMRAWERTGWREFPAPGGGRQRVHWDLVADMRRHPPRPSIDCSTIVVHGRQDDVVPLGFSRAYAQTLPNVRLVEVDDDHGMAASVRTIAKLASEFLIAGTMAT